MSQVNHEQSNPVNKDSKGTLKSVRINGVTLLSGLFNFGGNVRARDITLKLIVIKRLCP